MDMAGTPRLGYDLDTRYGVDLYSHYPIAYQNLVLSRDNRKPLVGDNPLALIQDHLAVGTDVGLLITEVEVQFGRFGVHRNRREVNEVRIPQRQGERQARPDACDLGNLEPSFRLMPEEIEEILRAVHVIEHREADALVLEQKTERRHQKTRRRRWINPKIRAPAIRVFVVDRREIFGSHQSHQVIQIGYVEIGHFQRQLVDYRIQVGQVGVSEPGILLKEADRPGYDTEPLAIVVVKKVRIEKNKQIDIERRRHDYIPASALCRDRRVVGADGGLVLYVRQEHDQLVLCFFEYPAAVVEDIGKDHPVFVPGIGVPKIFVNFISNQFESRFDDGHILTQPMPGLRRRRAIENPERVLPC